jgi:hypothetical protein
MVATLSHLTEQFSDLVTVEANGDSLTAAAKNIRKELKKAHPFTKFAVSSKRFSMGNSITVSWVDGPMIDEVERITNKYVAGSFDGMEDIYNYEPTDWTKAFGSAKYVSELRGYSDSLIAQAISELQAKYPGNNIQGTVEDFRQGRLYTTYPLGGSWGDNSLQSMIYKHLEGRGI